MEKTVLLNCTKKILFFCTLIIIVNYNPSIILPIVLFCFGFFFLKIYYIKTKEWIAPFFLFQLVNLIFFICGFATYLLRSIYYTNKNIEFVVPFRIYILTIVVCNFTYYLFNFFIKSNTNSERIDYGINSKKSLYVIFLINVLSYSACYKLFGGYLNAPIFSENIDAARFALTGNNSRGYLWFLLFSSYHAVILTTVIFIDSKRSIYRYLIYFPILVISCIPLVLYGGRSLIVIPALVCIIYYIKLHNIDIRGNLFKYSVIILLFIQVFGIYRQYNGNLSFDNAIHYIYTGTFPEVRTISLIGNLMKNKSYEDNYKSLYSFIAATFPKSFFELFGLNKRDYLIPIGTIMSSYDPNSKYGQGYRVTLFGEIGLLSKTIGTFLWSAFIGIFFVILDKYCLYIGKKENLHILNSSYLIVFSMATIPYGTTFISTICWIFIQLILVNYIIRQPIAIR
jgi:hypothetical protein